MNTETTRIAMLLVSRAGYNLTSRIRALSNGELLSTNASIVVLCQLAVSPSLRPLELIDSVKMTSGGLTKLLDRLEDAGLVARLEKPPEEDGRGVEVALTAEGRRALDEVLRTVAPHIDQLIEELSSLTEAAHHDHD
jgi:DNA-binding MarR family transcriptional regulator